MRAALRELDLGGRKLLVAVSGGIDSVALLHALAAAAGDFEIELAAAHVHHGLREEADGDADFVAAAAEGLGIPCTVARVDPLRRRRRALSSRERPTLQEAARRLRYDALAEVAVRCGACSVATAHTLDDQAETVLLRVLRGTGPSGLAGIAERSPWPGRSAAPLELVRPLLGVSRAEVVAFARFRHIVWREDRTNGDPRYPRNRLRRDWLPALRDAFNPRLLRALGDLAEAQRREGEWREELVLRERARRFTMAADGRLQIEAGGWDSASAPTALARRLVRQAFHDCGAGRYTSHLHLDRVLAFLRHAPVGAQLDLPASLTLRREAQSFSLGRKAVPRRSKC